MITPATSDVEPMPAGAAAVFGARLPVAIRYVELLATTGVERGLIGPAERPRLWTRHVLNSAAIAAALPPAAVGAEPGLRVVDVGSGAGLPGIPLALARPDLAVTLLEPLARRAAFLHEAVAALGVEADVVRGRAEDVARPGWDVVVARAVAPLERLLVLADHLVHAGGMLVAVKGRTAEAEVAGAAADIARRSSRPAEVLTLGDEIAGATVVRVLYDRTPTPRVGGRRRGSTARRRVS